LWHILRAGIRQAGLAGLVAADQWGIECRSLTLDGRRLFYVINHRRQPVEVRLKSAWSLAHAVELRTARPLDARILRLESLEIKLVEVR